MPAHYFERLGCRFHLREWAPDWRVASHQIGAPVSFVSTDGGMCGARSIHEKLA
jgi:hypothetical protein